MRAVVCSLLQCPAAHHLYHQPQAADQLARGQRRRAVRVCTPQFSFSVCHRSFVARWGVVFETARGPEVQYR